jgi:hypothetical protein
VRITTSLPVALDFAKQPYQKGVGLNVFLCSVSTTCTSKSKSKGPEFVSNIISGRVFEVIVTD